MRNPLKNKYTIKDMTSFIPAVHFENNYVKASDKAKKRPRNPSFFTKAWGRAMMVIGKVTCVTATSFILGNLLYAAGPISLIACSVVMAQEIYESMKKDNQSFKEAFKAALPTGLKVAAKFFIVFMSWATATAFITTSAFFAGPWMVLGILGIAAATAAAFTLATLLFDILPEIKSLRDIPTESTAVQLWNSFAMAFMEGLVWASIEAAEIYSVIGGVLGKVVDVATVSLSVSHAIILGGFFGSIIERTIRFAFPKALSPVIKNDFEQAIEQAILHNKFDKINALQNVDNVPAKALNNAILYIKRALLKKDNLSTEAKTFLESARRFGRIPVSVAKETRSKTLLNALGGDNAQAARVEIEKDIMQSQQCLQSLGIDIPSEPVKSTTPGTLNQRLNVLPEIAPPKPAKIPDEELATVLSSSSSDSECSRADTMTPEIDPNIQSSEVNISQIIEPPYKPAPQNFINAKKHTPAFFNSKQIGEDTGRSNQDTPRIYDVDPVSVY